MATLLLRDLTPGTHYYLQFRSDDGTQVSEWSRRFDLVTSADTTPPDVPLWAVTNDFVVDGDTFVANWQPIDTSLEQNMDFSHYELVLDDGSTTATIKTNNTSFVLSFEQNRIFFGSPQATVSAKIRSLDTNGNASAYTSTKTATNPPPPDVASVTVTALFEAIKIDWPQVVVDDLYGYRVQVSTTSSTSGYFTVYEGTDNSYTYGTLLYATDHYVRVWAIDKFGSVSVSPVTSGAVRPKSAFALDTVPPANPTGVTAATSFNTTTQESYIDLSWTANTESDLVGYIVRYGQVSGSWTYLNVDSTGTGIRIVVTPGKTYYLGVAAKDMSNNLSGYTVPTGNPITATADTTAPSTPAAPTVSVDTLHAQVVISGNKAAGGAMEPDVNYYEVYGSTTTGFTPASGNMLGTIQNGPAIIGTFDIPASGSSGTTQTWYFKIIAVDNASNKSAASAQTTGAVGLIATANIGDLVVTNAKINDLNVNKLTAGVINTGDINVSSKLIIGDATHAGAIESYGYVANTTGFHIDKTTFEINQGSISAAALLLQDSNNIMPNSMANFELDEIYYFDSSVPTAKNINWSSATSMAISLDVVNTKFGTKSLKIVQSAATGRTIYLAPTTTSDNIFFPNDGSIYFVSFWVRPTVTNAITAALANGNTTHTTATMKRTIDDATTLTANTWQQVYLVTTAVNLNTGNVRITLPAVAGTWNIDGVQVEKKIAASSKPGAWSAPSTTEIAGGMIVTGAIESINFGLVYDTSTNTFSTGTRPTWSIDVEGDATFSNVAVIGNLFVGDQGDAANASKYVAMSAFYSPGTSGWIMRGDGVVEFNQITTNTLDGQAIITGSLAADTLGAGTLGADIAVKGGGGFTIYAPDDTTQIIKLNPTDGLVIDPPGTGYIAVPSDGSQVIIRDISLTATDAKFSGNVQIWGLNNYISGQVMLEKTVPDPATAPTVVTGWSDPSTYLNSSAPAGYTCHGLTDDAAGTHFVTMIFNGSAGKNAQIWSINKTTGAFAAIVGSSSLLKNYTETNTGPDTVCGIGRIVVSSTSYYAVLVHYPAVSGTAYPRETPSYSYSYPAIWEVRLYNASTNALFTSWTWTQPASTLTPALTSDGTNIFIGYASSASPYNFTVVRYTYSGGSATTVASSTGGGVQTTMSSLCVTSADIGSTRYFISGSQDLHWSLTGTSVANDTATTFSRANGETSWGLFWDGTQFQSINANGKVYKHSTFVGSATSRAFTYEWYDSDSTGGTHRSLESPVTNYTTARRGWFKVTTPAAADNGGTNDPDSVLIYIDGIEQSSPAAGVWTKLYSTFATSGTGPLTGTSDFASLAAAGSIITRSTEAGGSPTLAISGDGTWSWDPAATQQVACSSAVTSTTTGVSAITGWSVSVTVASTDEVYIVDLDPDLTVASGTTAIVELYLDGSPVTGQIVCNVGGRMALHKRYRVTGLSVGSHTFAGRLHNTASSTSSTVNPTHSLMTVHRVA